MATCSMVQRGRGVEQLERLLIQMSKKKMIPGSPFINPFTTPVPHFQEMLFQPVGFLAYPVMDDPLKELSSMPNNVSCGYDGYAVGYKIDDGGNTCLMNQFGNEYGENSGVKVMDAGKARLGLQASNVRSPTIECQYFPGKGDTGGGGCCGLITSIRRLFDRVFRKSNSKAASQSYGVVPLLEKY